ncbi:helix-turn-helix domain-containing protein [Lacticaseibacillus mingshuiensis]|uniref:Helix-turn-helix domain-containing protein n=1 Tax=Lacticaseibacillus mingshuiensis TaxID=2799574 RepID=A0ABW4CLY4_9LACO|nr:helix-turn-helix transcriptional regulator [Lacticaseibacillus mingshuiensis]
MEYQDNLISRRLEQILEERNLTANRLAMLAGVSQSSVSAIINLRSVNPGVVTLARIADGLGMSLTELLDFPPYNIRPDGTSAAKQRDKWEQLGDALTPEEQERVRRILAGNNKIEK